MKRKFLAVLVSALALAACTDHHAQYPQQQQYQSAPVQYAQPAPAAAPVIVQAAPQHSGGGDMLTGALLGGVAGHLLTKGSQPAAVAAPAPVQTRVIERRTVVNNYITKPAPAAPVAAPAPAPAAPVAAMPVAASYRPTYSATPVYRPSVPASRPTVSLGKR